jgi:two-component system, sensor histidine kinase YesM
VNETRKDLSGFAVDQVCFVLGGEPRVKFTSFQKKLLATYSLLIILLVVILAILFYSYSSNLFEQSAKETTTLLAAKFSDQLDNVFKPMDFISTNLISDASFKSAISVLDTLDRDVPGNSRFLSEAEQTIRRQLYTYSIIKNFHAVTVFNRMDDLFTSNFLEHVNVNSAGGAFDTLPWMERAKEAGGRLVIVPVAKDPFQKKGETSVFGMARVVPGLDGELGCIAVFHPAALLENVFVVHEPNPEHLLMLAYLPTGELLYQNRQLDARSAAYFSALHAKASAKASTTPSTSTTSMGFVRNPVHGAMEFTAQATSEYTGITVMLVLNRNALLAPLTFARNLTMGIGMLIILFSLAYNIISSRVLTKPLRIMQSRIEDTQISNLAGGEPLAHENDEIVALDHAFMELKKRLLESIGREVDSKALWLKARLDSLQSQVDPHFINNILTVVASRGLEVGDDEICTMCDAVASMLRYSTSTDTPWALMSEEREHLETYLYLIKQRLEDRLEYTIEFDNSLDNVRLPKIVFQQIAENSINHGYTKQGGIIRISVCATRNSNRWQVEFTDNGEGIAADVLARLWQQMDSIRQDSERSILKHGLKVGGLGLINTYARLYLFYQGDIDWEIQNIQPHGVRVIIGAPLLPPGTAATVPIADPLAGKEGVDTDV